MKVLVTGSHGMIGSRVVSSLNKNGHQAVRLVRSAAGSGDVVWDPRKQTIDAGKLEGFDAVVHLAGDGIASGRWTAAKKEAIRSSRVDGTKFLCGVLASLKQPPAVLAAASAIGYYGNRGDEVLDESSACGTGFLAEVCRDWELATEAASKANIRVANMRIGVVLDPVGGALQKMLPPFQMGAGGILGTGKQHMSWVGLADVVAAVQHILTDNSLSGPVNLVAPHPVTNHDFTAALGTALHRPTIFPVPSSMARLVMGEMADELLLASQRVIPKKLESSGFKFHNPEVLPLLQGLFPHS